MNSDIQKTALRLPRELHTAIVNSAEKTSRTMNSEIVSRLELSLLAEQEDTHLLTAEQASKLAAKSRVDGYNIVLNRCIKEIHEKAMVGINEVFVEFDGYDEHHWSDENDPVFSEVFKPVLNKLKELGYNAVIDECSYWIKFGEADHG